MSERVYIDVDDVRFVASVTDVFADGDNRVNRLRQGKEKWFLAWEEHGWLYFSARRTIQVPRNQIQHIEVISDKRRKELGVNPLLEEVLTTPKQAQKGSGK